MTIFIIIGSISSLIVFAIIAYVGTAPLLRRRQPVAHYETTLDRLGDLIATEFSQARSSIRVYARNLHPLCWDKVVPTLSKILKNSPKVTVRFIVFKPPERYPTEPDNPVCTLGHKYAKTHSENFIKIMKTKPEDQFVVIDDSVLITVEPLIDDDGRELSPEKRDILRNGILHDVIRRVTVTRDDFSLASPIFASINTFDRTWRELRSRREPPRSKEQGLIEVQEAAIQALKDTGQAEETVPNGQTPSRKIPVSV